MERAKRTVAGSELVLRPEIHRGTTKCNKKCRRKTTTLIIVSRRVKT